MSSAAPPRPAPAGPGGRAGPGTARVVALRRPVRAHTPPPAASSPGLRRRRQWQPRRRRLMRRQRNPAPPPAPGSSILLPRQSSSSSSFLVTTGRLASSSLEATILPTGPAARDLPSPKATRLRWARPCIRTERGGAGRGVARPPAQCEAARRGGAGEVEERASPLRARPSATPHASVGPAAHVRQRSARPSAAVVTRRTDRWPGPGTVARRTVGRCGWRAGDGQPGRSWLTVGLVWPACLGQ